jgi:hypothetical protein
MYPYPEGYSENAVHARIAYFMETEHKSQPQAIAESLNIARRAWRRGHPKGPYPHHLKGVRKPSRRRRRRDGSHHSHHGRSVNTAFVRSIEDVRVYPKKREVVIDWIATSGERKTTKSAITFGSHGSTWQPSGEFAKKLVIRAIADDAPIRYL